jgi:hypothetical protein
MKEERGEIRDHTSAAYGNGQCCASWFYWDRGKWTNFVLMITAIICEGCR